MPATWTPIVPERIGQLQASYGLMFSCTGCSRRSALDRGELVRRWGEEARIAPIARRFRCSNCGRRGASVEVRRYRVRMTEAERVRAGKTPVDRLADDIAALKPGGQVS